MVRSLKNNLRKCDICEQPSHHEVCLPCQQGIDTNVRAFKAAQEPPVRKRPHSSWFIISSSQT